MLPIADGWPRCSALLAIVAAAQLASSCSPDTFLAGDDDRDRNLQRARDAERLGDFEGAAEYYERALERNPRSTQVHLGYGLLCEVRLQRYADAVYHYQRYLRLLPSGDPKADDIRRRVTNCTERLATSVPLVIRSETIARDLAAVRNENQILRAQVTNLWAASLYWSNEVRRLTQLASAAPGLQPRFQLEPDQPLSSRSSPRVGPNRSTATPGTARDSSPPRPNSVRPRTHRIEPGDTFHRIARRYGVEVSALRRANPRLDERRLRPGTIINVP
jgi:tetratricopeptide (TPR) repeat protein